jgi:hypothetical protein
MSITTTSASARWANAQVFRSTWTNGKGLRVLSRPASGPVSLRDGIQLWSGPRRLRGGEALLPEIPEGAFEEYRHDREARDEMRAIRARGEKLPSEVSNSMMRCVCGAQFESWKPEESYDHRGHIYAAEQQGIH